MDDNRIDKDAMSLEIGVDKSEESSSINQIHDSDASLHTNKSHSGTLRERQSEEECSVEGTASNLNGSCNAQRDGPVDRISITSSSKDNQDGEPDLPSTPLANLRRVNFSQTSSMVEVSSKDLNPSPLPRVRKGLEHSITAPVQRTLRLENESPAFSRSMTEKMGSPLATLKLDRLSEREKKKLIVEIVKIQNDGTVEVDLTKDSPVASELLELRQLERVPSTIDYITTDSNKSVPKLKIAVLVVGTRGDVQPFLAMAKRLQLLYAKEFMTAKTISNLFTAELWKFIQLYFAELSCFRRAPP